MTETKWRDSKAYKTWLGIHGRKKRVRITWLARARLLSGLSVVQAAKAAGLNWRSWQAWERVGKARREPDGRSTMALLNFFAHVPCAIARGASRCVTVDPNTLDEVRP